ncbi:hypothetical protein ACOSQ3_003670 [Xanthoceras sorbifolium]
MSLRQRLQSAKKGSSSICDFVLKIKKVGDALMDAREEVKERDLVLNMLNGLGHDYDPVFTMTLQDVQHLLMLHEQRIEQLNTTSHVDISYAYANYVSQSDGGRIQRGGSQSGGQNRGRGRGNRGSIWNNQKLYCQLCQKPSHAALQCYKIFDQKRHI